jgi:alpha-mannosidase
MHDDSALVQKRIDRFVRERLRPAIHGASVPLSVAAWSATDEPVPFSEAVRQSFTPFPIGRAWGRPWGTTWFHVTGVVPADWRAGELLRPEVVVDLGFSSMAPGFQAEGRPWSPDGVVLKAIEPRNQAVPVPAGPGERIDLYIEAASNPDVTAHWTFAPTAEGDPATRGADPI